MPISAMPRSAIQAMTESAIMSVMAIPVMTTSVRISVITMSVMAHVGDGRRPAGKGGGSLGWGGEGVRGVTGLVMAAWVRREMSHRR